MLFATGLGATDPPVMPGAIPYSDAKAANDVHVDILGWELEPADVRYAGLFPGVPGLYQVTIQVPSRFAAFQGYAPISLRVGNVSSPARTYPYMEPSR